LAWVAGYIPRYYTCPKTVTNHSNNRSIDSAAAEILELTTTESQVRGPKH